MNRPQIKGYCPGALRPMLSGDGLVVRVRPFSGRLTPAQAAGLAKLAGRHGNGLIDLSSRANLQLRGVTEESYPALISGLRDLELLDPDVARESRRNILLTPFWAEDDDSALLNSLLTQALATGDVPDLPGKFGFAVDAGETPVLQLASADIRFERCASGRLILVAEGGTKGKHVTLQSAIPEAFALAEWFLLNRVEANRMRALLVSGHPLPKGFDVVRQAQNWNPAPGVVSAGMLGGLPFGKLDAETLSQLASIGAIRMTPWRMLLLEGELPDIPGVIRFAGDPVLRVDACTGAPHCAQALAETRKLALSLGPRLRPDQTLHVSGCAKGCARTGSADVTLIGTNRGFDLVRNGRAGDTPDATDLSQNDILKAI